MNPRPRKLLLGYLEHNYDKIDSIIEYAEKYGIFDVIEKEVEKLGREETIQKR